MAQDSANLCHSVQHVPLIELCLVQVEVIVVLDGLQNGDGMRGRQLLIVWVLEQCGCQVRIQYLLLCIVEHCRVLTS